MSAENLNPGKVQVKVEKTPGEIQISLQMDEETYRAEIEMVAQDRGITAGQFLGEAFRLERLFAETRARGESWYLAKMNLFGEWKLSELIKP